MVKIHFVITIVIGGVLSPRPPRTFLGDLGPGSPGPSTGEGGGMGGGGSVGRVRVEGEEGFGGVSAGLGGGRGSGERRGSGKGKGKGSGGGSGGRRGWSTGERGTEHIFFVATKEAIIDANFKQLSFLS